MSLPAWCPPYSSVKKSPLTGEEVFCVCKKTDSGELMVGCDGCDDWFHFSCLKIPEKYKELVFSFYCPYCKAGITGPSPREAEGQVEVRKTIWKRKCRLSGCFKACKDESKYCSEEHGREYMQKALSQLNVSGLGAEDQEHLVKRILGNSGSSAYEFQRYGELPFTDEEATKQENPALYDKIVGYDTRLQELEASQHVLQETTIPEAAHKLEQLNGYLQWLEGVNHQLFSSTDPRDASQDNRKTKSSGKKQRKRICGYTAQWDAIPCSVNDFASEYDSESTALHAVCTKLRCNKHADWSSMLLEQFNDQLRSLQSHRDRLQLLTRTRKKQLMVQFHEQLLHNSS